MTAVPPPVTAPSSTGWGRRRVHPVAVDHRPSVLGRVLPPDDAAALAVLGDAATTRGRGRAHAARKALANEVLNAHLGRLHAAGWTLQSAAVALGCTRERVRQRVVRWGQDGRPLPDGLPEVPPVPMVEVSVVRPLPVLPDDVIASLRAASVVARRVSGGTPSDHPDRQVATALAVSLNDLRVEGWPIYYLAQCLGVSIGAVRSRLARYGHIPSSPSQAGDVIKGRSIGETFAARRAARPSEADGDWCVGQCVDTADPRGYVFVEAP